MKNDARRAWSAYPLIRRRLWFEWLLVAIVASLVVFSLSYTDASRRFDNIIYDRALDLFQPPLDDRILLVTIDDESLRTLGRWPWPRQLHAQMVTRLHESGAKAIAYDVLFPDPGDATDDAALASALALGTPVVIPQAYSVPGLNGAPYDLVAPLPELTASAKAVSHVNVTYDSDGVVRRVPLQFGEGADATLHMMEQLYRIDTGKASRMWARSAAPDHEALIPFQDNVGGFSTISFANILAGEVPPELIRGKLVLVGAAASGMGDIHPTPTGEGGTAYGVELMANILNAMETGKSIKAASPLAIALLALAPIALLLVSFWLVRPRTTLLLTLGLVVLILLICVALLRAGYWAPPSPALIGVVLVYPLWGWRRLQAMDDFIGQQLDGFTREDNMLPPPKAVQLGNDHIGERVEKLEHAISEGRSLRRFVSDILEQLPDPMILADNDGNVRLANEDADELFGADPVGQDAVTLLRSIAIADDRRLFDTINTTLDNDEDDNQRITFQSLAGRSYEIRTLMVHSDDGETRGQLYYLADVTGQKRAAEEREELLQLLTHDMRSPQSSILAMLDGVPPKPIKADDFDRIRTYARRTLTLADNFVHLARLKGTDFEPEFMDFADIVQEAADDLYTLAHRRKISIRVERNDEGEYWVMGEPGTLHRAFCNLFDNAVKYSPDKGKIFATLARHDDLIRCELVDQGQGISADLASRLFTRFGKGDAPKATADDAVSGAGLGLNFVQSVVERHGGRIWAENQEQGGARFIIELPIADEDGIDDYALEDAE